MLIMYLPVQWVVTAVKDTYKYDKTTNNEPIYNNKIW